MIPLEGSRHDNEIHITFFRNDRSTQGSCFHHVLKHLLHTGFDDMEFSTVSHFHNIRIDIDSNNLQAMLRGNDCSRKTDISESHKTRFHK